MKHDYFDMENTFFHEVPIERLAKFISRLDLYRKIKNLRGEVVECGVFKGNSLMQFIKIRSIEENFFSRKIYAFDTFDKFPREDLIYDEKHLNNFISEAGEMSISKKNLQKKFTDLSLNKNISLIEGNILNTLPIFVADNPQIKISLLHVDVDLYEVTKTVLNNLFPLVVSGGIVILDDYGAFPGANKAIDEYFNGKNYKIKQTSSGNCISYITKK